MRIDFNNDFLDDGVSYTSQGNPISFASKNITKDEKGYVLNSGFEFYNTSPINGIKSVTLGGWFGGYYDIKLGWNCPDEFPSKVTQKFYNGPTFIIDFSSELPSYFYISNTPDIYTYFSYIEFVYSCSPASVPSSYVDTNQVYSLKSDNTYQFVGVMNRNISSIEIPRYHNGKKVTSIVEGALSGCGSLTSVTLPFVGEKDINPNYPFGYIFGRESYTNSIKVVQEYYPENEYITSSVDYYLPNNKMTVTVLGGNLPYKAFGNYTKLYTLKILDSCPVNYLNGNSLCYGCTGLEYAYLPSNTSYIPTSCFTNCSSLHYKIKEGVTTIGSSAFANCTSLMSSIVLPNTVTSILNSAFSGCTSVQSIKIPASVQQMGSRVFLDCSSIYLYCEATSIPSGWNSNWNPNNRPVFWGIEM